MAHYSLTGTKAGKVYLMAGLAILSVSSWNLYDANCFLHKAIRGTGTIVDIHKIESWKRSQIIWSDVKYTTSKFQTVVGRYYESQTGYGVYIGKSVTFLYDPDNPQEIQPLRVAYQYPWAWLLLIVSGIVMVWIGARTIWNAKKQPASFM